MKGQLNRSRWMSRGILFLLLTMIPGLLLVGTCQASGGQQDATGTVTNSVIKQPIVGLIAMNNPRTAINRGDSLKEVKAYPDVYSGVVILAVWKYLEPQEGVYDFSYIDKELDEIREYNKQHTDHPISAKLRVLGGIVAPDYAKRLGGGPVTVYPNKDVERVKIGLFWTEEYGDRFAALQVQLAARYDNEPLLREVCISSAASLTDEPFVAALNQQSQKEIRAKGFTDELYKEAIRRELDDYQVWTSTCLDFPFNVFMDTDNGFVADPEFTTNLMRKFRSRYGKRAIIASHGLVDPLRPGASRIYPTIKELGPPVAFQTYGPQVNFAAAIKLGFQYGMTEFEVWTTKKAGGYADMSYNTLKEWAALFPPSLR